MKWNFSVACILLSSISLAVAAPKGGSQTDPTPKFTWSRGIIQTQQESFDEVHGIATDANGNVFLAGTFSGTISFGTTNLTRVQESENQLWVDSYFAKFTPGGDLLWVKQGTASENHVQGWSVTCDKAGNSYFLGQVYLGGNFGDVAFTNVYGSVIFKYSPSGKLLWSRVANITEGTQLYLDSNENVILCGTMIYGPADFGNGVTLPSIPDYDFFVAKYDSSGNILWARTKTGGLDSSVSGGGGAAVAKNGDIYMAGWFAGNAVIGDTPLSSSGLDVFVAKYDANGVCQWVRQSNIGSARANAVGVDQNGRLYVSGYYEGSGMFGDHLLDYSTHSMFVTGLNSSGNVDWVRTVPNAYPSAITVDIDGKAQIVGGFQQNVQFGQKQFSNNGQPYGFLTSCDASGNFISAVAMASPSSAWTTTVSTDAKRNIYVGGTFSLQAELGKTTLTSGTGANVFFGKLNSPLK